MRAFTQVENAVTLYRVLRQLWEYRESIPSNAQNDTSGQLKAKFFAVLDRLESDGTVTAHGVDEHRAEDAKAAEEAARAPKVFINYRRGDSAAYARLVQDRLEREWGRDFVFMDVDLIQIGADFVKILGDEVGKCDVLLALMGLRWCDVRDEDGNRRLDNPNGFVRVEIATALQRDIHVIPILLDGAKVPNERQLPEDLRSLVRRNGFNVRAICISFAALLVSIYALWNTQQQYQLSIKPSIDFYTNSDTDSPPVGIAITNAGPGPAVIKSVTFYVDRKPVRDADEAGVDYAELKETELDYYELEPEDTLAVGEREWLIQYRRVRASKIDQKSMERFSDFVDQHLAIEVTFCSISRYCWPPKCSTKGRCG